MSCLSWPSLDDCPCPCEACKRRRISGLTTLDNDQDKKAWLSTSVTNEEKQTNFFYSQKSMESQDRSIEANEPEFQTGNEIQIIERFKGNQEITGNEERESDPEYSGYKGKKTYNEIDENEENNMEFSSGILTFIKESIGVLAYLSFLTLCLWATLMSFALKLGKKFYRSKNRLQILACILIGFIVLLIILGYSNYSASSRAKAKKIAKEETRSFGKFLPNFIRIGQSASNEQNRECQNAGDSIKAANSWKFWSNWKIPETITTTMATKTTTPKTEVNILEELDEKRAQELMKQSKLYATALEMKRPPQLFISLREYFFQ